MVFEYDNTQMEQPCSGPSSQRRCGFITLYTKCLYSYLFPVSDLFSSFWGYSFLLLFLSKTDPLGQTRFSLTSCIYKTHLQNAPRKIFKLSHLSKTRTHKYQRKVLIYILCSFHLVDVSEYSGLILFFLFSFTSMIILSF